MNEFEMHITGYTAKVLQCIAPGCGYIARDMLDAKKHYLRGGLLPGNPRAHDFRWTSGL